MTVEIDSLRQQYSHLLRKHGLRQFIALSGSLAWCEAIITDWLDNVTTSLNQTSQQSVLSNIDLPNVAQITQHVAPEKLPLLLGRECHHFIFNAQDGLDPNDLGIIGGMIMHGGFLFCLLPTLAQCQNSPSLNLRFFTNILRSDERCLFLSQCENEDDKEHPKQQQFLFNKIAQLKDTAIPNWPDFSEQRGAIDALKKVIHSARRKPTVLLADRGRGKSAALGIAANELLTDDIDHIIVTAQSKQSVDTVFKHIDKTYLQGNNNKRVQFCRVEDLIMRPIKTDLVLVDEAATINLSQLVALLKHYPRIAFASTVHGYEGTGRGFILHFSQILDKHCRNWRRLDLNTPIRWAMHDPLEGLLFRALMLDADINTNFTFNKAKQEKLQYKKISAQALSQDESSLRQLFGLLTQAHYRTKPRDLKYFLDQKRLHIFCAIEPDSGQFVGACLLLDEGGFQAAASNIILSGQHRPKGHVLPQTLSMQCGIDKALNMQCARILRIVTHPLWRKQGIGSTLLQFSLAQMSDKELIGSSFSMQHDVLQFWAHNHFTPVRIGSKARVASAMQHTLYLYKKGKKATAIIDKTQQDLIQQWPFICSTIHRQTPPLLLADILLQLPIKSPPKQELLDAWFSFAYLNRPAESVMAQLQQSVFYFAVNANTNSHIFSLDTIQKAIFYISQQNLWRNGQRSKSDTKIVQTMIRELLKASAPDYTYEKLRKIALGGQLS